MKLRHCSNQIYTLTFDFKYPKRVVPNFDNFFLLQGRPGAIPNPESESKDESESESGFDSGFGIMCSGIGFGVGIV